MTKAAKDLYDLGEIPELGVVPARMHAQLIRPSRYGEPKDAFQIEQVPVPEIGPHDVLVYVMAAGVNYNNVWAALGIPVDVIKSRQKKGEKEDFHIGGSDASGIVWKTGKDVKNVKVGDEVVVHCGQWNHDDPHVQAGKDPMFAPTQLIWGYETNWGSFAQFTKAQDHMCLPKPAHLSWEEAAAYMLVGATAYRMLHGWPPNVLKAGDPVLIWGGAGGLGCMAIQIAKAAGARPVAVVGGADKAEYCKKLGAVGTLNRKDFSHWGMLPHWTDEIAFAKWAQGARAFGKAFWEALGEKANPTIVFEHPGEDTVPTSIFMTETGGMVVICAGTTGFNATMDLRYHWMRQKRFQGSHFANDEQAKGINDLVIAGKVDPCLSRTFEFKETGDCHQLMRENRHPNGNMSILVNATKQGLKSLKESR
jgi:crotonyl-CoA carboxylase/reductase